MTQRILCFFMALAVAGPAVAAAPDDKGTPRQITSLLACRALSDPAQRLACFDREASGVAQAIAIKDLVVIDRERVREARKGLFGFSVPSFGGLFAGDDDDDVKQLAGVVMTASRNPEGGWTVRLVDGSVWTQTDDATIALAPRRGSKVSVRRGTLGSFKLSINGQPGVRVKRIG